MAKNSLEINIGDQYYDVLTCHYITVDAIDRNSLVAICTVEEIDHDSDELITLSSCTLFRAAELNSFIKREV